MTVVKPNTFIVKFDQNGKQISWHYDGQFDDPVCAAGESQPIVFRFLCATDPQPHSVTGTLTARPMGPGTVGQPFTEGSVVVLHNPITLTVGDQPGDWGFSIDFTATWPGRPGVNGIVPDPELQVGSIPPRLTPASPGR